MEKTLQITGHQTWGILQASALKGGQLVEPWAVGHLDHAQAQGAWAEGLDDQIQDHS